MKRIEEFPDKKLPHFPIEADKIPTYKNAVLGGTKHTLDMGDHRPTNPSMYSAIEDIDFGLGFPIIEEIEEGEKEEEEEKTVEPTTLIPESQQPVTNPPLSTVKSSKRPLPTLSKLASRPKWQDPIVKDQMPSATNTQKRHFKSVGGKMVPIFIPRIPPRK